MSMRIAIQGERASFHDIAARKFFGTEVELVACDSFAACFEALSNDEAEYAVVAIENSLYGSINQVYDLLLEQHFWICGEVYLRIEQCLIGLPGTLLKDIREVHSHPVALAQCEAFLDKELPQAERFEAHDTASSVADVKRWQDRGKAAIAGEQAAALHGLSILASGIETNKQNYTRFVVLSKQKEIAKAADKTSLIIVTDHRPGALYHALGVFAQRDVNLTKLHSRPIIGQAWHYMFYIDIGIAANSNLFAKVEKELTSQGCQVTVLGSYSAGTITD